MCVPSRPRTTTRSPPRYPSNSARPSTAPSDARGPSSATSSPLVSTPSRRDSPANRMDGLRQLLPSKTPCARSHRRAWGGAAGGRRPPPRGQVASGVLTTPHCAGWGPDAQRPLGTLDPPPPAHTCHGPLHAAPSGAPSTRPRGVRRRLRAWPSLRLCARAEELALDRAESFARRPDHIRAFLRAASDRWTVTRSRRRPGSRAVADRHAQQPRKVGSLLRRFAHRSSDNPRCAGPGRGLRGGLFPQANAYVVAGRKSRPARTSSTWAPHQKLRSPAAFELREIEAPVYRRLRQVARTFDHGHAPQTYGLVGRPRRSRPLHVGPQALRPHSPRQVRLLGGVPLVASGDRASRSCVLPSSTHTLRRWRSPGNSPSTSGLSAQCPRWTLGWAHGMVTLRALVPGLRDADDLFFAEFADLIDEAHDAMDTLGLCLASDMTLAPSDFRDILGVKVAVASAHLGSGRAGPRPRGRAGRRTLRVGLLRSGEEGSPGSPPHFPPPRVCWSATGPSSTTTVGGSASSVCGAPGVPLRRDSRAAFPVYTDAKGHSGVGGVLISRRSGPILAGSRRKSVQTLHGSLLARLRSTCSVLRQRSPPPVSHMGRERGSRQARSAFLIDSRPRGRSQRLQRCSGLGRALARALAGLVILRRVGPRFVFGSPRH